VVTPPTPRVAKPDPLPQSPAPSDEEFQTALQDQFLQSLPAMLVNFRSILQGLIKSENEIQRITLLRELYRRIHALTGNAGIAGMLQIAQMADAMEALVKELCEKPKNITASTLRTVAVSVDFLGVLFEHAGKNRSLLEAFAANVLVVDDEPISRRAIAHALEKAKFKSVSVNGPDDALRMIETSQFDLIILDVDMPGMTGFELCSRLRSMPAYKKTPVVFVTSLTDFESRANSTISGGNDLIAKPFLFIELAVKTLVYVLRCRLEEANQGKRQN
jgi:CheY-like chemotaxis protein/HPt (histidine-containing phosphotransfer) domain-containing protein